MPCVLGGGSLLLQATLLGLSSGLKSLVSDKGLVIRDSGLSLFSTGSHREASNQPALCTAWSPCWLSVVKSYPSLKLQLPQADQLCQHEACRAS